MHKLSNADKKLVAKHLDEDDLMQLVIFFSHFDWDGNATLSPNEFRALFSSIVSQAGMNKLFNETDLDGSRSVDFGEFILALAKFAAESGSVSSADDKFIPEIGDIGLRHACVCVCRSVFCHTPREREKRESSHTTTNSAYIYTHVRVRCVGPAHVRACVRRARA